MAETSLAMILAGGKGDRLTPLTNDRAKPAVPFSRYRIVDHNASSLLNAGVQTLLFLPQYEPRSLDIHVGRAYSQYRGEREIRMVYPREKRTDNGKTEFAWYEGTAHAVAQNIKELTIYNNPDHVMIFAGDHVCALDVSDMLSQHHLQKRDLTIAAEVRPLREEDFEIDKKDHKLHYKYGLILVDKNDRITGFQEKPLRSELGEAGTTLLVSMGNYIFHSDPLVGSLRKLHKGEVDFGKHIIPAMLKKGMDLYVYKFSDYWRDVGDVVSYFTTCLDLNLLVPPLDYKKLLKLKRPVFTDGGSLPPTRIESQGRISTISEGCEVYGTLENCVLGQNVIIGHGSSLRNTIVFPGVVIEEGSNIRNAIIDKHNIIPKGITIGYDPVQDKLKDFTVVPFNQGHIAVVPRVDPELKR